MIRSCYLLCTFLLLTDLVQAKTNLLAFESKTGLCSHSQLDELRNDDGEISGSSVTLVNTPILKTRGSNPLSTKQFIPPLTEVVCHIEERGKVLVSTEGEASYCGWIDGNNLLKSNAKKTGLEAALLSGPNICGRVLPLTIKDFCKITRNLGDTSESCENERINSTVFETKFIVNNTSAANDKNNFVSTVDIPIYSSYSDTSKGNARVRIFNVLRIFDVKRNPNTSKIRYLVGVHGKKILGWIDSSSGRVWYSKLATFFSRDNKKDVLFDVPGSLANNRPLAKRPNNLIEMLDGETEYQRYPVLIDNRSERIETTDHPNLEIAFIGSFCGSDRKQLCSKEEIATSDPNLINQADILFLIDGTKSMQVYFDLVARAVNNIAKGYLGSFDHKFGVAMYGDYLNPEKTSISDEIQFKFLHKITNITELDVFSGLKDTKLFINDAMKDYNEASNTALLRAILEANWRGKAPKYIVHIGDHGDRVLPSDKLTGALKDNLIFYMPIAVKGKNIVKASKNFIENAEFIKKNHLTPNGISLSLPVNITYKNGETTNELEYQAIAQALHGAIRLGREARNKYIDDAYNIMNDSAGSLVSTDKMNLKYPPGYSALTEAAMELYINKNESNKNDILASYGYVETAFLNEKETNWDHFAAINPGDIRPLKQAFEDLCIGITDSDASEPLQNTVRLVIEILTGDKIEDDTTLGNYIQDKSSIPLSSRTLIGEGLKNLVIDLSNSNAKNRIKAYRRNVCRTAVLLKLMASNNKLLYPFEMKDGKKGDLIWKEKEAHYSYINPIQHNWVYTDQFDRRTVFFPLSYLPKSPNPSN